MALAIQKMMCCRSGRRSVMVKRDRVTGSWLGRHSRGYTCCSSASPLRLLGRKQPAWGNDRELSHPSTPKPSTPLRKTRYKEKLRGSCSVGWQRGPCGDQAGQGHLAFVGCHFWGRLPLIQLNCSKYSWLPERYVLSCQLWTVKPSSPALGCSKIKQNKKHLGNFSTAKLLFFFLL